MGTVVIELPQKVNRTYRVEDTKVGEQIFRFLEELALNNDSPPTKTPAVTPPRRNSLQKDMEAALGLWADREETGEEISRRIRDDNNGK